MQHLLFKITNIILILVKVLKIFKYGAGSLALKFLDGRVLLTEGRKNIHLCNVCIFSIMVF